MARPKSLVPFEGFDSRKADLIDKGGDEGADLGGKASVFYNSNVKLAQMKNLDKGIPKFNKVTARKTSFGSMYRHDDDLSPDFHDSVKVAKANVLNRKKSNAFVDMGKQSKRDFTQLYMANDSYKNVVRENARNDYIKQLLRNADAG